MTIDELVIQTLGKAQLQAMRDLLEKQALKEQLSAKTQEATALKLALDSLSLDTLKGDTPAKPERHPAREPDRFR